jgi:hypothetical protein
MARKFGGRNAAAMTQDNGVPAMLPAAIRSQFGNIKASVFPTTQVKKITVKLKKINLLN